MGGVGWGGGGGVGGWGVGGWGGWGGGKGGGYSQAVSVVIHIDNSFASKLIKLKEKMVRKTPDVVLYRVYFLANPNVIIKLSLENLG